MNLSRHIIQLLESSNYVTLPGLGRFDLIFVSSFSNFEEQQAYPPTYTITFSQQYDLKDDFLINQIAQTESKDPNLVKILVENIIKEWKTTLEDTGSLFIKNLGTLTIDKENIFFEVSKESIFNYKNYGLPKLIS